MWLYVYLYSNKERYIFFINKADLINKNLCLQCGLVKCELSNACDRAA